MKSKEVLGRPREVLGRSLEDLLGLPRMPLEASKPDMVTWGSLITPSSP